MQHLHTPATAAIRDARTTTETRAPQWTTGEDPATLDAVASSAGALAVVVVAVVVLTLAGRLLGGTLRRRRSGRAHGGVATRRRTGWVAPTRPGPGRTAGPRAGRLGMARIVGLATGLGATAAAWLGGTPAGAVEDSGSEAVEPLSPSSVPVLDLGDRPGDVPVPQLPGAGSPTTGRSPAEPTTAAATDPGTINATTGTTTGVTTSPAPPGTGDRAPAVTPATASGPAPAPTTGGARSDVAPAAPTSAAGRASTGWARLLPPVGPTSGPRTPGDDGAAGTGVDSPPSTTEAPTGTGATPSAPTGGAPALERSHTVRPGEHFWAIASDRLEEATGERPHDREVVAYWLRLVDANRDRLVDPDDPDLIHPGLVLRLPEVDPTGLTSR